MTEPPVLVTEPPPPSTTTTTPTPPPTTTTTTTTTTAPTIDIDIDLTEDYWPFPSPLEDIDLPEGGAQVVFKPERSGLAPAPAPAPVQYFSSPLQYFRRPFTLSSPFQPLPSYVRYVV